MSDPNSLTNSTGTEYELLVMQYPLPPGQNFRAPMPSPDCEVIDSTPMMLPMPQRTALLQSGQMQVAPVVVVTYRRPKPVEEKVQGVDDLPGLTALPGGKDGSSRD